MKYRLLSGISYTAFPSLTAEQLADALSLAYRALRLNHLGTIQ